MKLLHNGIFEQCSVGLYVRLCGTQLGEFSSWPGIKAVWRDAIWCRLELYLRNHLHYPERNTGSATYCFCNSLSSVKFPIWGLIVISQIGSIQYNIRCFCSPAKMKINVIKYIFLFSSASDNPVTTSLSPSCYSIFWFVLHEIKRT